MTSFADLGLDPKVLASVVEAGYDTPTPIQEGAIPPALEGRDVLGIAQTGTGKTAGFTLPMIHLLARGRARARMPRSLVLAPTRELAAQVAEAFDTYARGIKLTKALLIGGVSFKEQDKLIDKGVDVLIATPGRLLDHHERGKLLLSGVQIMVVDEADRMLDMGFIPDIERIFQLTPFTRQTLFFSATMPPEIERITNTFLNGPARIEVARQATAAETIDQGVIMFQPSRKDRQAAEKRALLRTLIDGEGAGLRNAIIFCNRKIEVAAVAKSLAKHGYDAAPIHGDLDQSTRTATLNRFRDGTLRLLIASDVAARGLDVPDVSHIINFDVPSHAEDYIHRIGRTGRAGRSGRALTICAPNDRKYLDRIEELIGGAVPRTDSPSSEPVKPAPAEAPAAAEAPAPAETAPPESGTGTAAGGEDAGKPPRKRRRRGGRGSSQKQPAEATTETADPARAADTGTDTPAPAEAKKTAPERRGKGREKQGENEQVVGMGDHVPAFIARPLFTSTAD